MVVGLLEIVLEDLIDDLMLPFSLDIFVRALSCKVVLPLLETRPRPQAP
jgi:hypothetical protein